MVLLLDLPDMLIVAVLQKWINVADLAWLDSAMCSNHARRNFLCLLSEDNFFIDQHCGLKTESYELADLYTSWILRGQIGIAELIVTDSFANVLIRRPYLKLHGYSICNIIVEDVPVIQCTRGEMLGDLRRYCPSVKVLCCRSPVPPAVQISIAAGWKQLTHLTLEGCDINEELVAGVKICQALVKLSLLEITLATHIAALLRNCSLLLQIFTIDVGLRPEDYVAVASRYPLLRELNVLAGVMDDMALIALGTGCPHLTMLDVRYESVTGIGILAVVQNRALVTLQLEECTRATDSALKTVVAYCPLLEVVSVMYCFQLTDIALIALGQHCPKLRVLVVDYMSVTNQGIAAIAAGCPLLEELSVCDCPGTGAALAAIARSCPRLRRFNASHSKAPPDAVLALARYCPLLEHFDIRGSNQVGDDEIKALARGCPALKTLDIIGASVTERGLRAVRKYCRNLQKIELTTRSCPGWTLDKRFFPPEVCVEVNAVIVLPCGRVLVPRS
jgi:hypothetical protein